MPPRSRPRPLAAARPLLTARLRGLKPGNRRVQERRTVFRVSAVSARAVRASLSLGAKHYPCALGRTGTARRKRESDGATPAGLWRLMAVLYRPDRLFRPRSALPVFPIGPGDGWCDDPRSRAYNRPVALPFEGSHEKLWRDDGIYDVVVVLAHNVSPAVAGHGSAIFMHVARPGLAPTDGCIALEKGDLLRVLDGIGADAAVLVCGGTACVRPRARRARRKSRSRPAPRWRQR